MFFTDFKKKFVNILELTVASTLRYRKSDNWIMVTVHSELKVGNLL